MERSEPGSTIPYPLYLKYYWVVISVGLVIYYITRIIRCRNYKILSSFEFNTSIYPTLGNLALFAFLFALTIVDSVMNSYFLTILYSIFLIALCISVNLKVNNSIKKALYTDREYNNRFTEFINYFMKFSRKYGGIIVVMMVIVRRFIFDFKSHGFIEQISAVFFPLVGIIGIWFVISMKEETMQGYYLKKYPEEYRVKYGYSKKEWYGEKSKEYKKELAEQ